MDMKTNRTYRLNLTDTTVQATSPTLALRELCKAAGLTLASQNGRYGKTTDGEHVAALLAAESSHRVRYADHGTTRL